MAFVGALFESSVRRGISDGICVTSRKTPQAASASRQCPRLSEFIEPAMAFLARNWNIYRNGNFALKRTVLKPAFAEPLR